MKFAWPASHESYQPELLVEQAVLAESAGFDMVLASDHFHPWVDDTSAAGFAWSWRGAVAARPSEVELGTSVTCPLFHYHPALIAQAAATVDRLSGGRFTLGLGTGEAINDSPLGWRFPGYAERMTRMREALSIIRRLLDGEKLDFDGEYYRTKTARLYSASPQDPATGRRRRAQDSAIRRRNRGGAHNERQGSSRNAREGHRAVPGRVRGQARRDARYDPGDAVDRSGEEHR